MSNVPTLYLVTNSPGEVTTFVRPVVRELARSKPDWKVQVCLVPCPYATGAEKSVIEQWAEHPSVWTPWETTKAWFWGVGRGKRGLVAFLGGDPWHALLLKHRFRMPAVAYFPEPSSWERTRWLGGFDLVAKGYRESSEEISTTRSVSVSDLRVDAVLSKLSELPEDPNRPLTLAVFPGSRWLHLKSSLGPFLYAVERVREKFSELRVLIAASPFVSRARLADAAANPFRLGIPLSTARLENDRLITEQGASVELVWGDPYRVMWECDLALSLPGTNTAELAIAGKPTVVPLSPRVPVGGGGLLGILERFPGFDALKGYLKARKHRRISWLALPNQIAGRMVMPEFMVDDGLDNLVGELTTLLSEPERRREIGRDAQAVMGSPGGAAEFVRLFEGMLG